MEVSLVPTSLSLLSMSREKGKRREREGINHGIIEAYIVLLDQEVICPNPRQITYTYPDRNLSNAVIKSQCCLLPCCVANI